MNEPVSIIVRLGRCRQSEQPQKNRIYKEFPERSTNFAWSLYFCELYILLKWAGPSPPPTWPCFIEDVDWLRVSHEGKETSRLLTCARWFPWFQPLKSTEEQDSTQSSPDRCARLPERARVSSRRNPGPLDRGFFKVCRRVRENAGGSEGRWAGLGAPVDRDGRGRAPPVRVRVRVLLQGRAGVLSRSLRPLLRFRQVSVVGGGCKGMHRVQGGSRSRFVLMGSDGSRVLGVKVAQTNELMVLLELL